MHTNAVIRPSFDEPPLPKPEELGTTALLLDVDGTLLDFAATPETVTVPPGLSPVIDLLGRTGITIDFLGLHTVVPIAHHQVGCVWRGADSAVVVSLLRQFTSLSQVHDDAAAPALCTVVKAEARAATEQGQQGGS